jgi:hypothetical protein
MEEKYIEKQKVKFYNKYVSQIPSGFASAEAEFMNVQFC